MFSQTVRRLLISSPSSLRESSASGTPASCRLRLSKEKERIERRDAPGPGCRRASITEDEMTLRTVLFAAAMSAAVGLFAAPAASATPANGAAISQAAKATQATEQVWWRYRYRWHWRRW
jgi:hypothetical protein